MNKNFQRKVAIIIVIVGVGAIAVIGKLDDLISAMWQLVTAGL